MSTFLVEAMDPISKQIGTIEVKADSEIEARTKVERGGYKVIELRHAGRGGGQGAAAEPASEPMEPPPERTRPAPRPAAVRDAEPESEWSAPPRRSRPRSPEASEDAGMEFTPPRRAQGGSRGESGAGGALGGGGGAVVLSVLALLIALGALGTVLYFNLVKKPGGGWRNYDWSTPAAAAESAATVVRSRNIGLALDASANGVLDLDGLGEMLSPRGQDRGLDRFLEVRKTSESLRVADVVKAGDDRAYAVYEAKERDKPVRVAILMQKFPGEPLWQVGARVSVRDLPAGEAGDKVRKLIEQTN
jgi:hypothetical protein